MISWRASQSSLSAHFIQSSDRILHTRWTERVLQGLMEPCAAERIRWAMCDTQGKLAVTPLPPATQMIPWYCWSKAGWTSPYGPSIHARVVIRSFWASAMAVNRSTLWLLILWFVASWAKLFVKPLSALMSRMTSFRPWREFCHDKDAIVNGWLCIIEIPGMEMKQCWPGCHLNCCGQWTKTRVTLPGSTSSSVGKPCTNSFIEIGTRFRYIIRAMKLASIMAIEQYRYSGWVWSAPGK